jgi:hypothetical protein
MAGLQVRQHYTLGWLQWTTAAITGPDEDQYITAAKRNEGGTQHQRATTTTIKSWKRISRCYECAQTPV